MLVSARPRENLLWPQAEGYDRAAFLPIGKRAGGKPELAWPGAIRDAVNDLGAIAQAPGEAYKGTLTAAALAALPARVMQSQLLGSPAGFMEGAELDAGESALQHNIFAGVRAKTANMPKLGQALTLEGRGAAPADIHAATGWFRGPDNKWRFEIPDSGAKLFPPNGPIRSPDQKHYTLLPPGEVESLSDVLNHPALHQAYPQLQKVKVDNLGGGFGSGVYSPENKSISIGADKIRNQLSTLLHETQHGVQDIENFAEGGSPDQFLSPAHFNRDAQLEHNWDKLSEAAEGHGVDPDNVMRGFQRFSRGLPLGNAGTDMKQLGAANPALLEQMRVHFNNLVQQQGEKNLAQQHYNNLAGEVEARAVQERHQLGDHESFPPSMPGYTPFEKQIVTLGGEQQPMLATPVDHDPFASAALIPIEHDPWLHTAAPVAHDPFATPDSTTGAAK